MRARDYKVIFAASIRDLHKLGHNNQFNTHYIGSCKYIIIKLTFPRSKRYWHFVRQSGELVKVESALSAAFLVAVSVASYNCLQRRSSWAISCQEKQSIRARCTPKMNAGRVVWSSMYNFFPGYLFLHFCFGTRRGQAHVACACRRQPLITSRLVCFQLHERKLLAGRPTQYIPDLS